MRLHLACAAALFLAACGGDVVRSVTWPDLGEDTLSFLRVAGQAPVGPFDRAGPTEGVVISGNESLELISFDVEWLAGRHVRVDRDRLDELRLVERPGQCSSCESACRGADDELIFHPARDGAQRFLLRGSDFVPFQETTDLWLRLPARWACERGLSAPSRRIATWPPTFIGRIVDLGSAGLLAIGNSVRRVSDRAGPGIARSNSFFPDAVRWGDAGALVLVRSAVPTDPGRVLELDLTGDRLEIVRETELSFNPAGIHGDDRGVIVSGVNGEIATSTNGASFVVDRRLVPDGFHAVSRINETPEYFIGASFGRVFRGDPWTSIEWSEEFVTTEIDYPMVEVFEVVGPGPNQTPGRWLWSRSGERGSFIRRLDGGEWFPTHTEPPREPAACTQGIDACGFARYPHVTSLPYAHNGRIVALPAGCDRILVANVAEGCATSIEVLGEAPQRLEYPPGTGGVGDTFMISTGDGVLAVPLP